MPKPLREFKLSDWIRFRPILQAIKTLRYRSIDTAYCKRSPARGSLDRIIAACKDRQVIVTIAFNDLELIEIQTRLVKEFIPHAIHLVADNSSHEATAISIENHCLAHHVNYLRLPSNPWQGLAVASRSHGQAMNWVWRRIIMAGQPKSFGFIDHDLFPTCPCNPFEQLEDLPFFGDKRWAGDRWFLWAGYCFYRFPEAVRAKLDFSQDWFIGLDTGGANWDRLYSRWDPGRLPDRKIFEAPIIPGVELRRAYVEWRDDWIHEVGLAGDMDLKQQKRAALIGILRGLESDLATPILTTPC